MTDETGWVIERGDSEPSAPTYWAGLDMWSQDHMDAIRFARKRDAERVSARMTYPNNRVCEHMWTEPRAAPPPPSPVMSEEMRQRIAGVLRHFHRDSCYPEAADIEILVAINALTAALSPAPAREVGWRMVPVEPTQAMMDAGIRARAEGWGAGRIRNAYLAMLAAAPLPASPTGGDKP
jgi:hypothetical protein